MSDDEVQMLRKNLGNIKIRGTDSIKPIFSWYHCGLPKQIYSILEKSKFKAPFPVQCQTIPVLMSGRDAIVIAETGSGKTLAYILPMLRHIKAQISNAQTTPMGLVMVPTRELAL